MNRLALGLLLAALLFAGRAARAQQQGFALDTYAPVAPAAEWFANDSLDFRGEQKFGVGLLAAWAHKPLVLYSVTGAALDNVVQDQLILHIGAQFLWKDRLRLALDLPVGLYQGGNSTTVAGVDFPAPSGTSFADPRIAADVRLFGAYREPITMSLGADVYLPIGSRDQYTGDGRIRVGAHLRAAGQWQELAWSGSFGWEYRSLRDQYVGLERDNVISLDLALGTRVLDDKLLLGPEFHLATQVGYSHSAFDQESTPAELLFGAHYRIDNQFDIGVGAGPGLTEGVGSPAFRALLQVAWMPREAEKPKPVPPPPPPPPVCEAPPPCPDCPKPEPKPEPPPPPPAVEPPAPVKRVMVVGKEIRIPSQIVFGHDSAKLARSNDPLLKSVASTIVEHPEIKHLRIEGHTSSVGLADHNLALSKARAKAVMAWLVAHGIAPALLTSRGYGAARPLYPNDTKEHEGLNRRVEFHIVTAEEAAKDRADAAEEARLAPAPAKKVKAKAEKAPAPAAPAVPSP